jgi:hypothetical protein
VQQLPSDSSHALNFPSAGRGWCSIEAHAQHELIIALATQQIALLALLVEGALKIDGTIRRARPEFGPQSKPYES